MNFISYFVLLLSSFAIAQPTTEIYLLNITVTEENFSSSNFRNISNNAGYDNQPFFVDNNHLLYAKNREGQTDIANYEIATNNHTWLSQKTPGGEYSPQPIPTTKKVAAVRLDPDGKQRLYRYSLKLPPEELLATIQVAYYAFYNEETLLASVLAGNQLDLILANTTTQKIDTLLEKAGRSIHKVPQQKDMMSYTSVNEDDTLEVYQLDINTKESFFVTTLPIGVQDMIWLSDSKILIGSGPSLFLYDLFGNGDWKKVVDFSEENIKDITRLAVSPDKTKLALVVEMKK